MNSKGKLEMGEKQWLGKKERGGMGYFGENVWVKMDRVAVVGIRNRWLVEKTDLGSGGSEGRKNGEERRELGRILCG